MFLTPFVLLLGATVATAAVSEYPVERQLTHGPGGRVLTNTHVWSPDGKSLVFDVRGQKDSSGYDGDRIELIDVKTGHIRTIYRSKNGAGCLVVTFHPAKNEVVFILGPEHPTPDWKYGFAHRQGVIVDLSHPGIAANLEARNITAPFTPGALRGGSHVHVFSHDGACVSFTYNDHVLPTELKPDAPAGAQFDQRNVGVAFLHEGPVHVPKTNIRNHDGTAFTILATRTVNHPKPGSDEIEKAYEDGWVGHNGYVKSDGTHQKRAIAFQGDLITADGKKLTELFVVDLPENIKAEPEDGPLAGTEWARPLPPKGTVQRRITHTEGRKYPGLGGTPRQWMRSTPDGSKIAFMMHDDAGIVQMYTVSPNGGEPVQVTHNPFSITSTFNWSPDGTRIAYAADGSVFITNASTGKTERITARRQDPLDGPGAECVDWSPDGRQIAFLRHLEDTPGGHRSSQIFVVDVP